MSKQRKPKIVSWWHRQPSGKCESVHGRLHVPDPKAVERLHRLVGHGKRKGKKRRAERGSRPRSGDVVTNLIAAQRRKRRAINKKNCRYSDKEIAQAHKLYQQGHSAESVSRMTKISAATLRRRWAQLGAPRSEVVSERAWRSDLVN